jgi:hypothetical protein
MLMQVHVVLQLVHEVVLFGVVTDRRVGSLTFGNG